MKTIKLLTILALMLLAPFTAANAQNSLVGDVNKDGRVDISDAVMVVDIILHGQKELSLSVNEISLYKGNSATIVITSGYGSYTVTSTDTNIADATLIGSTVVITGKKGGTTVVKVIDTISGNMEEVDVKVLTSLSFSAYSAELKVGETTTIEITSGNGNYEVTSSNTNVVEVTFSGTTVVLKGKTEGVATVTVKDVVIGSTKNILVIVNNVINDTNGQQNQYGKAEYYVDSIKTEVLILDSAIDYHVTNAIPMGNTQIQLNHDDAWLILENVRPSAVVDTYLKNIMINGYAANNGSNCRVAIYLDGAVVIPQNQSSYLPFIGFEDTQCSGESYPMYTGRNALGDNDHANNRIRSFVLKRGYMATVATTNDGTGYSRVFVADHKDLVVNVLPTALDRRISYINIKKWNYVSKKGWSSTEGQNAVNTEGALVKSTWFYSWSADKSNQLDMEYVPMNTHQYWPSVSSIAAKTDCTHMLSINEPEHAEQHTDCSCNEYNHGMVSARTAMTWTPRYQTTGMRIGSPCPTDSLWLKEYIGHIDEMAYRCDFVTFHAYWGSNEAPNIDSWYSQLKSIYDATKRPIWLTEFNNGASWTSETKPTYETNGRKMAQIIQMLEDAPFIERYCIYNWDDWHLAVLTWDNDKKSWWVNPAGQAYRDVKPHFGYNADIQKIPNWWGFDIKCDKTEFSITSLTWNNEDQTGKLTIKNENIDQTDVLTLECQTSDGTWETFREIDERELFDNTTFNVFIDGNADVLSPYYIANPNRFTLRLTIKDIKGDTAISEVFNKEWPSWM